ncbi:hypothetical protein CRUP_006306 [Coryphaenoides rupestris]|nr:hypothetical protein CRUP_006306 [Coryphaenoides rupestris]
METPSTTTPVTAARGAALCAAAALNVALVFVTCAELARFVSFAPIYRNITGESAACPDAVGWMEALGDGAVLRPLLVDTALLALFVAQHSLLAWAPVKRASGALLGPLSRAAYCSSTALVLQILMKCWQPVHSAPCLWAVRTVPWSVWFPVLCFALHFLCWALMFSTLLLYDYLELLGVKQLCVVLWLLPALPLDRLLLAGALTGYLGLAHSLDRQDLAYLCTQFNKKLQVLASPPRDSSDYTLATSRLIE